MALNCALSDGILGSNNQSLRVYLGVGMEPLNDNRQTKGLLKQWQALAAIREVLFGGGGRGLYALLKDRNRPSK